MHTYIFDCEYDLSYMQCSHSTHDGTGTPALCHLGQFCHWHDQMSSHHYTHANIFICHDLFITHAAQSCSACLIYSSKDTSEKTLVPCTAFAFSKLSAVTVHLCMQSEGGETMVPRVIPCDCAQTQLVFARYGIGTSMPPSTSSGSSWGGHHTSQGPQSSALDVTKKMS